MALLLCDGQGYPVPVTGLVKHKVCVFCHFLNDTSFKVLSLYALKKAEMCQFY